MNKECNPKQLRILIVEDTPERQKILKSLYKDHAWILINNARRATILIRNYPFDLISLDYNLAGDKNGDEVAACIPNSINKNAKIIVHSQNKNGAEKIKNILHNCDVVPVAKMIKKNKIFKKIRQELCKGVHIDWAYVFRRNDE